VDKTDVVVRQLEKLLMDIPDVQTVFAASGTTLSTRGNTTGDTSYMGSATVRLKADRKKSTRDIIKYVQKQTASIPATRITVTPYDLVTSLLSGGSANMEVDVIGRNLDDLTTSSKQVVEALRGVPGLESVDVGVQDATPEMQWRIDREKAQKLGVNFADISSVLNTSTGGSLASFYQENGYQYPIYVQVPVKDRKSQQALLNLPVTSRLNGPDGQPIQVRLSQVASPTLGVGPNEITRVNRQRYLAINGRVQGRAESDVQADVGKAMDQLSLPEGVRWQFGSNQRRRAEEFSGLGMAVFLAIALIYMLLASQFESFIHPLVVLTSVPLCVIGVILALFITGRAFGLTAFIGLLMLVGIVVKNGILLVDYTNRLRAAGLERDDAILMAGPTRLRPILMTTCAAILGMFPLALALGRGSETQAPLATAVIGGLMTSTFLTLFIVPVVYSLFDDVTRKRKTRSVSRSEVQP
jgi:HAE1 family hydrophobic/amphiphilic exporter-1